VPNAGQFVDEEVGSRPGADPNNALGGEFWSDALQGGDGGPMF